MRERLIELLNKQRNGKKKVSMSYEEFADFLLANGVIVLPCQIGKTIYDISEFVDKHPYPEMYEFSADEITLSRCRETKELIFSIDGLDWTFEEFGEKVFPTEAEALKALAEREGKG